ncbi:DUF11 domain-containing protein [Rhizorhabdus dicambivorans]|uniref:DUF11 domain-containing protein n=1 Tax=Rhizorhabdus dicambivorans TaxID=1850238 RepID=A0A2A4FPS7_9SPHN|nr:DUF11 domain-containing protein [Rhizorhabdus dicambivorans]ATE64634.1 hypothetical protein CMV14_09630 [Rhizorhabdus dicambivorans]PCE40755.1 hypothetical protein COO09_18740 [Rhizorhabdus dicambivorans]
MLRNISCRGALSATALSLVLSSTAHAASGTTAGTSVTNTASVAYTIGGVAQTPVSSNAAAFLVDRKVNVTVAQVGGQATNVTAGDTNAVIAFTVTNNTNAVQDFRLIKDQQNSLVLTLLGHSDSFDVDNLRVFVDSNGNGTYEAGTDTATYIDELAADASVTVFLVADIPTSLPANPFAGVGLIAVAAAGGSNGSLGSDLVATLLGDTANAIDNVFADASGTLDATRDGRASAVGEYAVGTASIEVTKTAVTISDPLNLGLLPKAIPGAVIEYCIQVKNAGTGTATNIAITDPIPANSTFQAGSILVGGTTLLGVCNADGSSVTDANDSDTGEYDGTNVKATIASLAAGATRTARFRVTVN